MIALFENRDGERVAIEFETKRIDGFVAGVENDCVKLTSSPDGKGTIKYVPWPNSAVLFVEFLGSSTNRGKVGF
jgi:hypothetical protein